MGLGLCVLIGIPKCLLMIMKTELITAAEAFWSRGRGHQGFPFQYLPSVRQCQNVFVFYAILFLLKLIGGLGWVLTSLETTGLGQLLGEVGGWNPSCPLLAVGSWKGRIHPRTGHQHMDKCAAGIKLWRKPLFTARTNDGWDVLWETISQRSSS